MGALEAQQLGEPGAVGVVLDHAQLDVGAELLPELVVVVLLCDLLDHVQGLAHQLLADDLDGHGDKSLVSGWHWPHFTSTMDTQNTIL